MTSVRPASSMRLLWTGLVLAGIVVTIGLLVDRGTEEDASTPLTQRQPSVRGTRDANAEFVRGEAADIEARPAQLQLGLRTPCDGSVHTEIELFNRGDVPASIDGWITSSSAIVVDAQPGFVLAPKESCKVELRISPWSYGENKQRVEFRVKDSPTVRVGVSWEVQAAIWAKPALIVRPNGTRPRRVILERIGAEGAFLPEPFTVLSVHPLVAFVDDTAAAEAGVATLIVDFKAIDDLAEHATKDEGVFTFGAAGRWKTLDILVRTDCGACPELHLLIRNQ
ncbi:MAG: hypothetical protein EXS10_06980 [Phycisphaerales bacterium]|nr:hypothetical protein [Phycisphaerales bacterium]